jgi:hypothetical protein
MSIPGVRVVETPVDLARAVRELAAIVPHLNKRKESKVVA